MKYAYSTLSLAALVLAETHQVQVGPGLNYSPNTLTAAEGDIVQFTFGSGHNVVSGSFDQPCQPDGTVYSGEPNDGDVFSMTVSSSDPMWIYCSVPMHCERGMVMVINPSSDGNTLDAYKSAASDASGSSAPPEVVGGTFGAVSESSAAASSATAAESSAAPSAASSAASSMASATESAASQTTLSGTAATASSASVAESAATAAATGEGAGGSDNAAGSVVAPLSVLLGAVVGGAALML